MSRLAVSYPRPLLAPVMSVTVIKPVSSTAGSSSSGLHVSWWPGEPAAERTGQPGDRVPRGRPADLPGEPSAGEARRDDVCGGGDCGQAVLDVRECGTGTGGESQPRNLGAVQDVDVHV